MNQAVPVSIELSPKKTPAKFKIYALVFALSILLLQLVCPAWKIVWTRAGQPAVTKFERPFVEAPLARSFVFRPPNIDQIGSPPLQTLQQSAPADLPSTSGTVTGDIAAQIDWKSTAQMLLISLAYLSVGAFGVFSGKPDRSLLTRRIRQFASLSIAIVLVAGGMAVYSCAAGKMSPQAYWHKMQ